MVAIGDMILTYSIYVCVYMYVYIIQIIEYELIFKASLKHKCFSQTKILLFPYHHFV